MKIRTLLGIGGILVLATACIPSLNPFFTEKDVTFDARLVGEWQSAGKTNDVEIWKFEKAGDNAYTVTITDKEHKNGTMDGHLFTLDSQLFLDLIPRDWEPAADQADIVGASLFAGHLLLRVPQIQPTLRLAFCDYEWLGEQLEAHPDALAHHAENKRRVLTATTKELQAFVTQHLKEMFGPAAEFERRSAQ